MVMKIGMLFQEAPLWLFFLVTVAAILLSVFCGFCLGAHHRKTERGEDAPIGSIVGATLGLLAFILAFTFGMTASRFDSRKQLLLEEVNAIGTAFLRCDFLPEPQRVESQTLFRKYVDIRAGIIQAPEKLPQVLSESESIHTQLWSQILEVPERQRDSEMIALYVDSLNDVIVLHEQRVTIGLQYRIPEIIWLALYFITILSMIAVGYQFGIAGKSNTLIILLMVLAFSVILVLISDLDRSSQGVIQVSQKPMLKLQEKLHAPAVLPGDAR